MADTIIKIIKSSSSGEKTVYPEFIDQLNMKDELLTSAINNLDTRLANIEIILNLIVEDSSNDIEE